MRDREQRTVERRAPQGETGAAPAEAGSPLQILQLSVGALDVNCYVLLVNGAAVVVDPGEEGDRIASELRARGAALHAVWLTHAHFDHVGGITALLANRPPGGPSTVPVLLHPADQVLLENAVAAAARWSIHIEAPPLDTLPLEHGQVLELGGVKVTALHTPGHAPGHCAFHIPAYGAVLSGDALFKGSVGRTDLPLADERQLLDSIHRELLSLPDDTAVLPGHGPSTTIGAERYGNPFL